MVIQVVSVAGALLVLSAFAASQLKKLDAESRAYQLMNLFGGFFLFLAAMESRQAGLIVIEAAWTLISAWGLWQLLRRSPSPGREAAGRTDREEAGRLDD